MGSPRRWDPESICHRLGQPVTFQENPFLPRHVACFAAIMLASFSLSATFIWFKYLRRLLRSLHCQKALLFEGTTKTKPWRKVTKSGYACHPKYGLFLSHTHTHTPCAPIRVAPHCPSPTGGTRGENVQRTGCTKTCTQPHGIRVNYANDMHIEKRRHLIEESSVIEFKPVLLRMHLPDLLVQIMPEKSLACNVRRVEFMRVR